MRLVYIVEPNSGPEFDMARNIVGSEFALVVADVESELVRARAGFPAFNSAHEGFAVLREEVDELWKHVKTNQKRRDLEEMRREAVQVAAVAIRFALEVCDNTRGRK